MAWVAAGTAAVGAAGQIFGAIKGAKANKANQALLQKSQQENKAMYDKNANQSFLDTNVAKSQVTQATNDLQDERKAVAGRSAITGASDEAAVASNSNVTKNYNEKISRLAGMGTAYQTNQEGMYRNTKMNLDNQQTALNTAKADNAANLAENAGNLVSSTAMGINSLSGISMKKDKANNAPPAVGSDRFLAEGWKIS